jgi:hypothetical protein
MILTKKQQKKMLRKAIPLIKWINKNCHPHCTAIVDAGRIELVEGIAASVTDKYIKD